MSSEYLADYIENAEFISARMILPLESCELDNTGIQELCSMFRQHGVCSLLLNGDVPPLLYDLMRSSSAYIKFLECADKEQIIVSRAKPFYDALCGGYFEAAKKIALLTPLKWNKNKEYNDDFLFIKFLFEFFFLEDSSNKAEQTIKDLEEEISDGSHYRILLCHSFLENNNSMFEEALELLLEERSTKIEKLIESESLDEEYWSWMRYFSSEGTALVRLAEKCKFRLDLVIRDVPSELRMPNSLTFDRNAWKKHYPVK